MFEYQLDMAKIYTIACTAITVSLWFKKLFLDLLFKEELFYRKPITKYPYIGVTWSIRFFALSAAVNGIFWLILLAIKYHSIITSMTILQLTGTLFALGLIAVVVIGLNINSLLNSNYDKFKNWLIGGVIALFAISYILLLLVLGIKIAYELIVFLENNL